MSYDFKHAIDALYKGHIIRAIAPHHEFILRNGKIDFANPEVVKKYYPEFEPSFSQEEIDGQWDILDEE